MTQESMMTEAPTTTNEAAVITQESAKADVTTTETGKTQQVADATTTGNADGDSKEAVKTEEVKTGAPEKYEFKAPEGRNFDNEVINTFSEVAKELNLNQESAQKVLDRVGPKMVERQMAELEKIRNGWIDSSKSDKEFGGDAITQNLSVAKKALDTFGTPELRTLLNQSGLGNHPELIRFFYRAGKTISEDSFVGTSVGAGSAKGQPRDFASQASMLYSNQNPR